MPLHSTSSGSSPIDSKDLAQTLDLLLGLCLMRLERLLQLRPGALLGLRAKGLDQLLLSVQHVLQFVNE